MRRRIHGLPPHEDVQRELRFHLAMRAQELEAAGWEPAAARAEAERLFGDVGAVRTECNEIAVRQRRSSRRAGMWNELRQDLHYALRWLARERGFAFIAIATLALGIGANSATFGIVNGVLFSPLPYPAADRLVGVWEAAEDGRDMPVSYPNFQDWHERMRTLSHLAAYTQPWPQTVLGGAEPVRVPVTRVSRDFFAMLGVAPARGRTFTADEQVPGGRHAVVVSHAFWQTQLGAEPDLARLRLELPGGTADVVGVMPPDFGFPRDAQIWHPLELTPAASFGSRSAHNFEVVGRLAGGMTRDAARVELSSIAQHILATEQGSDAVAVNVHDLHEQTVGNARRALFLLLGASAFVLLVACTNLASALLARATRRSRELAVRAALGASRMRLVRQLLTESLVLAVLGAAAGLLLAHALINALLAVGPDAVPRLHEVGLDARVLGFTMLITVLTALAFGTAPALRATTAEPSISLRGAGRNSHAPGQRRVWSLLVGAEVALALLLLVGSGLLIRSFWNVTRVDPGFAADGAVVAALSLPASRYVDGAARARYYDALLERVRALPGVQHAAITTALPFSGAAAFGWFAIDGGPVADGNGHYRVVSPEYLEAMRIPLLHGRNFTDVDRAGAPEVILVNRTLARRFFPDADPIGARIRTGGMDATGGDRWTTIIGVVGDVHHSSLTTPPSAAYYLPYAQRTDRIAHAALVVRSATPRTLAGPLRATIRDIDDTVPVDIAPLHDRIGASLAERRFMLLVLGVFAAIALSLALVGIYGVVAFAVAQRTREIGVRVALGAEAQRVLWTVGRGTMVGVLAGIAIGLAAATFLSTVTTALLFEVEAVDPLTFAAVAALLLAVACIAVIVPARRALLVTPMLALRTD